MMPGPVIIVVRGIVAQIFLGRVFVRTVAIDIPLLVSRGAVEIVEVLEPPFGEARSKLDPLCAFVGQLEQLPEPFPAARFRRRATARPIGLPYLRRWAYPSDARPDGRDVSDRQAPPPSGPSRARPNA